MSIRDWPVSERPREKLLELGSQVLSEAELLAILIRTGTHGNSAVDIARSLLTEFGSLRGLLTAPQDRVCATRGLGRSRYAAFQAALELTRRHYQELMMSGSALCDPRPPANSCACSCGTCLTRSSAVSTWTTASA
jgi:DNA repair protein RadC